MKVYHLKNYRLERILEPVRLYSLENNIITLYHPVIIPDYCAIRNPYSKLGVSYCIRCYALLECSMIG